MEKPKAFTLIELLVVLSILALLMAIMLPALQRIRQIAIGAKCASRLRQIGLAQIAYATANKDIFTPCYADYPGDPNKVWQVSLKAEIPLKHNDGSFTADRADTKSIHCCPAADYTKQQKQDMAASYGLNSWLMDPKWSYDWNVPHNRRIILVGDMQEYNYDMVGTSDGWFQWGWRHAPVPGFRHLGEANMAFVDGSIERLSETDLSFELGSLYWKWWQ